MENFYVYLNKDNSVKFISELYEESNDVNIIMIDNNKYLHLKELMEKLHNEEKVFYVNNDFIKVKNFDFLINELKILRDKKLAETDYLFLVDNYEQLTEEEATNLKELRYKLRHVTDDVDDILDILNALELVNNIY